MFDIAHLLIGSAQAADTAPASPTAGMPPDLFGPQALVFLVILGIFYFLLIRPQQKKIDQHNAMLKALKPGDRVITAGGLIATVVSIEGDDRATVALADKMHVQIVLSTLTGLVPNPAEQKK